MRICIPPVGTGVGSGEGNCSLGFLRGSHPQDLWPGGGFMLGKGETTPAAWPDDKIQVDALMRVLEAVIDSSFDEIFLTDADGVVVKVNAACERLYGLSEAELVGKSVDQLEQAGVFAPAATSRVLRSRSREQVVQQTATGRRLVVTATPVFDQAGRLIRVVSISRDVTELNRVAERLAEAEALAERYRSELALLRAERAAGEAPVVRSAAMERVLSLAVQVAPVDATVLITGESGVGKEQIARYIHRMSHRSEGPFVKIDCGALPETLIESELFGYERGAFTGALREGKRGLVEVAHGGTLFLDEVGELPLALQVKLLRFLQDRTLIRVGGLKPIHVDVRVLAATNKDLKAAVARGAFREDLFYRLNVVPLHIPPLRERPEDVLALADHFLGKLGRQYARTRTLSAEAADLLCRYHWPGNVRELENLVERLVVTTRQPEIRPADLPEAISWPAGNENLPVVVSRLVELPVAVESVERQLMEMARRRARTTYEMAALLGVNQSTVVRKLQRYFPAVGPEEAH